jgi:aconitate hydratase
VDITAEREDGSLIPFQATLRLDTDVEIQYFLHGGVLQYVLRKILKQK